MKKPNALLKVVSILYIVFSIISAIVILVGSAGIGALLGGAAGDVGAGLTMAMFFAAISLISVIIGLVAGISGLKAENLKRCNTMAIILVVLAVLSFISSLSNGDSLLTAVIGLILPVLYMVGVRKEINERK